MRHAVWLLLCPILLHSCYGVERGERALPTTCNAVFVRWPRVRLNLRAVAGGKVSLRACQSACTLGEDPIDPEKQLECAALNHEEGPDGLSHDCQVFQPHQLQNVDGFVEADDGYSFYWKYCLSSSRKCTGEYAFTYLSDRYMESSSVVSWSAVSSLEECLSLCLDHPSVSCRSVSFNRTDGGCHLSAHSQLTRPHSIKINNNPNFRIDYYENSCYNMSDTFSFSSTCEGGGILVKIESKFPYTGALYGLYDFFTCRLEPKEQTSFQYFFPSPTKSKNCSDSIRYKGEDMVLEVVLSTDGVEPLYFITPEDITFQAKCPISSAARTSHAIPHVRTPDTRLHGAELNASAAALFEVLSSSHTKDTFALPMHNSTQVSPTTPSRRPPLPSTTSSRSAATTKVPLTKRTGDSEESTSNPLTTTTSTASTPTTQKTLPSPPAPSAGPPGSSERASSSRQAVSFDIFHNGLPVGAVVVGSHITLSFTPHYAIPPEYMSLRGCQVEPIGSAFDWEKEPLAVIKEGCPSDLVGIACPPTHTNFGLKVTMEAFRYQTTADIQYTCLVRVCPLSACPSSSCPHVDGCESRGRRSLSLAEIRAALQADPALSRQIGVPEAAADSRSQLLALAGDHVVKKRLVVVNSPDELRYFVSTGTLPT